MKPLHTIQNRIININSELTAQMYENHDQHVSLIAELNALRWVLSTERQFSDQERLQIIMNFITEDIGIEFKTFLKQARTKERRYCEPRQIIYYFLKKYTKLSYTAIGRIFYKTGVTVKHGIRTIENLMEVDNIFNKRMSNYDKIIFKVLDKGFEISETL